MSAIIIYKDTSFPATFLGCLFFFVKGFFNNAPPPEPSVRKNGVGPRQNSLSPDLKFQQILQKLISNFTYMNFNKTLIRIW